jgi:polar amino acid transport system substrate-binding protein
MPRARTRLALLMLLALLAALTIAACGDDDDGDSGSASTTETQAKADACSKGELTLVNSGKLTVGTDKPAFPPYFEDDDPTNGKGFESAVAYAIADQLGFDKSEVKWKVVPFNASFKPGPKDFDFDVNQISINEQRKRAVDFSDPYYTAPQGVIAPKGSAAAGATSLSELADKTIGVQIGTTSLDAVNATIKPTKQPKVFDDSNAVVTALKQGQVDAVVTDLPTAFYITAAQVPSSKIVGQFSAPGGDEWGALLEKDSALTACVDEAIKTLKDSGELDEITQQWMSESADAPVLQ